MLDNTADNNSEIYFLGDLNINALNENCPMWNRISSVAKICNLTQVVTSPTRTATNRFGITTATCIDHIYTNRPEHCSKAISITQGCSDHNLVAIVRKTRIPKANSRINFRRSYRSFNQELFEEEVKNVQWLNVCSEKNPEKALNVFMKLFMEIADKHAPMRKWTARSNSAPLMNDEMRILMAQRNAAKKAADRTGTLSDRQYYCKLRNTVTKMNKNSKREY